jgi:hypothetical protein
MLESHRDWLRSHVLAMARHAEAMTDLDKWIAGLVSGIGELIHGIR